MSQNQDEVLPSEPFALYGFELKIPETWRVEFNPKGTRDKGDVVFHSPKRNRITAQAFATFEVSGLKIVM